MKKSSIPNILTAARVAIVPIALLMMWLKWPPIWFLGIFIFASLTDFLDGYLARKWHCTTAFGALADPVADKLLVSLMLLFLLQKHDAPLTPVAIIILREIYVSALRDFISAHGSILPVSRSGKWKTALQMVSITGLLAALTIDDDTLWNYSILVLWIAAILAITSAITYSRVAWPLFKAQA